MHPLSEERTIFSQPKRQTLAYGCVRSDYKYGLDVLQRGLQFMAYNHLRFQKNSFPMDELIFNISNGSQKKAVLLDQDLDSTRNIGEKYSLSDDCWIDQFLSSPHGEDQNLPELREDKAWPIFDPNLEYRNLQEIQSDFNVVDDELGIQFPLIGTNPSLLNPIRNQGGIYQADSSKGSEDVLGPPMDGKGKKQRKKKASPDSRAKKLKNFLLCVSRGIVVLKGAELQLIQDEAVAQFLNSRSKVNKRLFQNLFKNDRARIILSELFSSNALHRQLQLSVMSAKNRKVYLQQLHLLKKALINRQLPNL